MSSLRHITLPGLFVLLATLVLRLQAGEAEWLAAFALQLGAQTRGVARACLRYGLIRGSRLMSGQTIIHPREC